MSTYQFTRNSQEIQMFLEKMSVIVSERCEFVKRERSLTAPVMAKTLIMSHLKNPAPTLSMMAQTCHRLGISVTPQAINKRMNESCAEFMQGLFQEGLQQFASRLKLPEACLNQFSAIHMIDSTQIQLHKALKDVFVGSGGYASPAAVKLQVVLDYLSGQIQMVDLTSANVPDQACDLVQTYATPNSLNLFDKGYLKLDNLRAIHDQGAFFVTRFDHQVKLYDSATAETPIDLLKKLSKTPHNQLDWQVYMGKEQRLPVRLVLQRCPTKVVEQRRRAARQREKKETYAYSKAYLALLAWEIVVTNVPAERLDIQTVLAFYTLRWQIELTFKLWKSHLHIDTVRCWRVERLKCHLYACLTGLLIFYWIVQPYRLINERELSPVKAFHVFQLHVQDHLLAWCCTFDTLPHYLADLASLLERLALKDSRKKSPSTRSRITASP